MRQLLRPLVCLAVVATVLLAASPAQAQSRRGSSSMRALLRQRFPNLRPFLTIPDILAAIKTMRALNPEVVIPAHGSPGTTKPFRRRSSGFVPTS